MVSLRDKSGYSRTRVNNQNIYKMSFLFDDQFYFIHIVLSAYVLMNNNTCDIFNSASREISNNVVCATSKASDQHAHTRSLIRAFASRLNIM